MSKEAEPVYQIAMAEGSTSTAWIDVAKDVFDDAGMYPEYKRRALYTRPEPEAEPVFIRPDHLALARKSPFLCQVGPVQVADFVPLYTRPEPARKPMTEEEMDVGFNPYRMRWLADDQYFVAGVRFAEKHHGIGVDDNG